jgi:hypothetical protein
LLWAIQTALRRVGGLDGASAGVVALGVFGLSGYATLRLALVRPYLLALLLIVGAWAAARSRARGPLLGVGIAYPLAYLGWPAGMAVVAVTVLAEAWVRRERPWVAGVAWMGLGNTLGIAVHPRPRALLEHAWVENGETLLGAASREGVEVGAEFARFSAGELLRAGLVPLAVALVAALVAWRGRGRAATALDTRAGAVSAAALAVAFALLTLRAQRFVEVLVPFAVLALGLAWRPRLRPAVVALVGVGTLAWGLDGGRSLRALWSRRDVVPPVVAERLSALVPPNAPVFTCSWGATGELLRAMPGRRAMVALNPTHFARIDPMGYRLWVAATHAAPPSPVRLVRERFASDYAVCERNAETAPFRTALARDPELRAREVVGGWEVFDVRETVAGAVP